MKSAGALAEKITDIDRQQTSISAVSAALVEERMVEEMLKQFPIYFVSEALSGLKPLYSEMQW